MNDDIAQRLCSGIKSLDKLRFKAAGSRTGCIMVSIEELNAIRTEIEDDIHDWPCQDLYGGRGAAIYNNVDGRCQHP